MYVFRLEEFLSWCKMDISKFLKLKPAKQSDIITHYLVQLKLSASSKNLIFYSIKHALEMNDVILNWKKIKRFIKGKTGNEIVGSDRGYTHEEIQKILQFADQRVKTAILILSSTGVRIGALVTLKLSDLEKIDDLYKIKVYSGDREQYTTFATPECAKEIDAYLESRTRKGEKLTKESYLMVKEFRVGRRTEPFLGQSLRSLLQNYIQSSGIREIDHDRPYRRKETPILHAFRKFTTKQLVDSNVKAEIREMLLGHKIGLTGVYYRPTEKEMLNEYLKAVPALTINNEERLKFRLEERITIERTQMQKMQAQIDQLLAMKKKKKV